MEYTRSDAERLLHHFEASAERVKDQNGKVVKLVATEGNLLKAAVSVRDFLDQAVKGDKQHLAVVFGAEGELVQRFRKIMAVVVLSDLHERDQRWLQLATSLDMAEEVLKQLGHFKPHMLMGPPEALAYKLPPQLRAGDAVQVQPRVGGGAPTAFQVVPALPSGLSLDSSTGEIAGRIAENIDLKDTTYLVTALNHAGSTCTRLRLSVLRTETAEQTSSQEPGEEKFQEESQPTAAEATTEVQDGDSTAPAVPFIYERPQVEYVVGNEVALSVGSLGMKESFFYIEPALPEGLEFHSASGEIRGCAREPRKRQAYTVTVCGKNQQEESVTISFAVLSRPPSSLSYDGAGSICYSVGASLRMEPQLVGGDCSVRYSVTPALPLGLQLDGRTGIIEGKLQEVSEMRSHEVQVTNDAGSASCVVSIAVVEADLVEATGGSGSGDAKAARRRFAESLRGVKDVGAMPPEPEKRVHRMMWIVHRAWLDDPSLQEVNFTNQKMPAPQAEPLVAPRLVRAMVDNAHIRRLLLDNSNLQAAQGHVLAEALETNTVLEVLNVESNVLDTHSIAKMAIAVRRNPFSALFEWRLSNQKTMGGQLGAPAEEALAGLMDVNTRLLTLGCELTDRHLRFVVEGALVRNNDAFRRKRVGDATDDEASDDIDLD